MVKNTAYAWRQMIFFLSLASEDERRQFLIWAEDHVNKPSDEFQQRFRPAMIGMKLGLDGALIEAHPATGARRFLGWSKEPHWLLAGRAGEQTRERSSCRSPAINHAAVRKASTRLSQPSSWFQLAKFRLTIFSSALSDGAK